jgi:hypothetical protein
VKRLVFALIAVTLFTHAGETASSERGLVTAPSEAEPARVTDGGRACVGPCVLYYFNKGTGSGRVWSTPAGIDCRATCAASFASPSITVTLRAEPDPGSAFAGWEGCKETTADGACVTSYAYTDAVCTTFDAVGSPTAPNSGCPPAGASAPSPPAPPPAGDHPPVGSPCTISGSARANVLRGTAANDVICGRGGNDSISGGGGHDLVLGGAGDDRVLGQTGRDYLSGGRGNDVLVGGGGDDELLGGHGADLLRARDGDFDLVRGGPGRDRARVDAADLVRSVERRF